jgi:hypothetical protein
MTRAADFSARGNEGTKAVPSKVKALASGTFRWQKTRKTRVPARLLHPSRGRKVTTPSTGHAKNAETLT